MNENLKSRERGYFGPSGPSGNRLGGLALALAGLAVFLYYTRLVLIPFVVAGAVAYVLSILVNAVTRRTGLPRAAIAAGVFFLFLAACAGIAWGVYPSISSEAALFVSDLKGTLTKTIAGASGGGQIRVLGGTYDPEQLADQVQTALREWISQPSNLFFIADTGFSTIFSMFLGAVLLFYFLLSGQQLVSGLISAAPPAQRPLITKIINRVDPVLRRYFVGVAIIVTYAAVASYIGLGVILGVKHAVFLAIATGFLELIPVLGPLLAAVLAGMVALQGASGIWDVLKYVLYASALRLSIDQVFGPLVLGRAASLHPVTIIFCFLTGGLLYGIAGVIMAVPVALAARITLKTIYGETEEI